ncbi:MAG: type II toxin-antitoxin system HicB family antitoxin [Methanogenium sp.]|jgi:predicted RNase H-like HicB family nuclease
MIVDDYLKLPYTVEMICKKTGFSEVTYFTSVKELPGCWSEGATPNSAWNNTLKSIKLWIVTALIRGLEIPLPEEK